MCRLFGQISNIEMDAGDFLVNRCFSLLRQSSWDKKHLQKDGWGIGEWKTENREWKIVKSSKPVFKEQDKFKGIAKKGGSKIILAHIRKASNPKKLQRRRLVASKNCQPFAYQNLIFAHNGTLNIPDEVAESLGRYKKNICGINDSEVLFWLFVKIWEQVSHSKKSSPLEGEGGGEGALQRNWKCIFQKMRQSIQQVWNRIPRRERKFSSPWRGLNCIASDGKSLAAHCYYQKREGKSLCGQNRPYFEMCYNILQGRIVVASEPMDDGNNWKPIRNKHLVVINSQLRVEHLQLKDS